MGGSRLLPTSPGPARGRPRGSRGARGRSSRSTPEGAARTLPGVGEYTAGAVASIAFGRVPPPAVDGNVRRVLSRLFDEPRSLGTAWLRTTGRPRSSIASRPGDWNQALMELGSTVCTPRSPRCSSCPWEGACGARRAGTQADRPGVGKRPAVGTALFIVVVPHADGRVLLVKRPQHGLLAGMWAFPEAPGEPVGGDAGGTRAGTGAPATGEAGLPPGGARLLEELGLAPRREPRPLPEVRHRFTHLDALYRPWAVEVSEKEAGHPPHGAAWVDPDDLGDHALPKAQRKILDHWNTTRLADSSVSPAPA